jgi:hypothetical protein
MISQYVVTAPPGGLGHFLAKVIADDYNFSVSRTGSYHGLAKTYSSQTTQIEHFDSVIHNNDNDIICLHNFDNRDLSHMFPGRTVVNIVVDSDYEIYFNNYFRKAVQSSQAVEKNFLEQCKLKFPTSNNFVREEFYFLYQAAANDEIQWLPKQMTGLDIPFGSFYKFDTFRSQVSRIPGVDIANDKLMQIWNHFIAAQSPILDRVKQYQLICDSVLLEQPTVVPDWFDNVDFGIMCGMLFKQAGVDKLNLNHDGWI